MVWIPLEVRRAQRAGRHVDMVPQDETLAVPPEVGQVPGNQVGKVNAPEVLGRRRAASAIASS